MYEPPPPRPRKTQITRTKSGCDPCRKKRRKCDEKKPSCRRCINGGTACRYVTSSIEFKDSTQWAANKVNKPTRAAPTRRSNDLLGTLPVEVLEDGHIAPECAVSAIALPGRNRHLTSPEDLTDSSNAANDELSRPEQSLPDVPEPGSNVTCLARPSSLQSVSPRLDQIVPWDPERVWELDDPSLETSPASENALENQFLHVGESTWAAQDIWTGAIQTNHHIHAFDTFFPDVADSSFLETCYEAGVVELPEAQDLLPLDGTKEDVGSTSSVDLPQPGVLTRFRRDLPLPSDFSKVSAQASANPSAASSPSNLTTAGVPVSERRYLAHFDANIADVLPAPIPFLWQTILQHELVRYAAVALGAANLANLQGKRGIDAKGTWQPAKRHAEIASNYAVRCWTALADSASLPLDVRLTVLILLVCFEMEVGAVQRVMQAMSALELVVMSEHDRIPGLPHGFNLARNWLHFRHLLDSVTHAQEPILSESHKAHLIAKLTSRFAAVPQIIDRLGTAGLKICQRVLLTHCVQRRGDSTQQTLQKLAQWRAILAGSEARDQQTSKFSTILEQEQLEDELATLSRVLASLTAQDDSLLNRSWAQSLPSSAEEIKPVKFSDHREAMECADLIFAHLVCNVELLRSLTTKDSPKDEAFGDPWAHKLAQIAAGLDPIVCQQRNMYRKSITLYLHTACLFSVNPVIFAFLDLFLTRANHAGVLCEGSFVPIHILWSFNRSLQRHVAMSQGKCRIFSAEVTYTARTRREVLFSKGLGEHIVIFGRGSDGHYFSDLIPLIDGDEDVILDNY